MSWNLPEQLGLQADAIGEQQLKPMQSGGSRSGRNWGAVEADAIGEQQLKWTQAASSSWSGRKQGAPVEADRCNR